MFNDNNTTKNKELSSSNTCFDKIEHKYLLIIAIASNLCFSESANAMFCKNKGFFSIDEFFPVLQNEFKRKELSITRQEAITAIEVYYECGALTVIENSDGKFYGIKNVY